MDTLNPYTYYLLLNKKVLSVDELLINSPITDNCENLILVKTDNGVLAKDDHLLLSKIMKAVGLSLIEDSTQVQLLTFAKEDSMLKFEQLLQLKPHPPKRLICFGLSKKDLGLNINIARYRPTKFQQISILMSDPVQKLQEEAELKRHLWGALKSMFSI